MLLILQQMAAEYRRLSRDAADPLRRDACLEVAMILEIALRRLGLLPHPQSPGSATKRSPSTL